MTPDADARERPLVAVQGLGFVGLAMALAVASARSDGEPRFDVVGVELDTPAGRAKMAEINAGRMPMKSSDPQLEAALALAHETGNLTATVDADAYCTASVAVVDVHLDLTVVDGEPEVSLDGFREAIRTLGRTLPAGALVIVETTVPPGTCETVVRPELDAAAEERGMPPGSVLLAHSYERVMPGPDYFDSIVNFWRVYSGETQAAADACERFLSDVVNIERFPLTRVATTTASEIAKVLENSYRATTIAFMEEWGRFAESVDVDLFEVIDAIRMRPTHSNMRQPGFGVGGYCLPKDPLFAQWAANRLHGLSGFDFPFSRLAVRTNEVMPLVSVAKVEQLLGGLAGKRLLLMGTSYREGVDDMRWSPSTTFVEAVRERGADCVCHDPVVGATPAGAASGIRRDLPSPDGFDAVVFAVGHEEYDALDPVAWVGAGRPLIFDANAVLSRSRLEALAEIGCPVWAIGRGPVTAGAS